MEASNVGCSNLLTKHYVLYKLATTKKKQKYVYNSKFREKMECDRALAREFGEKKCLKNIPLIIRLSVIMNIL